MYEFMSTLSESRLIPSTGSYRQFTAEQLSELTVLNLCALYILYNNKEQHPFAVSYAKRTIQYGSDFKRWSGGATDLYVLMHGLLVDDVDLSHQAESDNFKHHLPIDQRAILRWLRELGSNHLTQSVHRSLFIRLDFTMKINNQSIRAIRRLVMDWEHLDRSEQRLAMTRMLQILRARAPRSEMLKPLRDLAHDFDLELTDVCNKETGQGCGTQGGFGQMRNAETEKKPSNLLATLAGVGAGVAASRLLHRK